MKHFIASLLLLCTTLWAAEDDRVIENWNTEFLSAVRRQAPPPCLVARNLAILHLSIWKAVQAARPEDEAAAATSAAHEVCVALFSGDRAGFDELFTKFPKSRIEVMESARKAAGAVLSEREGDGSNTTVHYHPDLAAGIWQRTTNNRAPELPHWGLVKPFIIASASEFRPPQPPALGSERYARDVNELRELGGAITAKRTKDQEVIARFWSDFSYTTSPAGRWNEIAVKALEGKNFTLRQKARLFAILNIAMADAGIAAWDCKYHYRLWRPITAIQEPFDDHNSATTADPNWQSMLPSPSHPEYVSGHSTFSGAAALVLTRSLGKPTQPIAVANREMPNVIRKFRDYDEIAKEAGRSRIYGGIHFQSANEQGHELGRKVASRVIDVFNSGLDFVE